MRISRQVSPVQFMIDQKQLENVEYFFCLGNLINYARYACDIKPRNVKAKAAFNKKQALFTSKLDLNLRKKIVNCYIWSTALCGAETWTLRKVDWKYLKSFEMWCWRRMKKISWTDCVKN
jgi:hypothetical protein